MEEIKKYLITDEQDKDDKDIVGVDFCFVTSKYGV